MNNLLEKCLKNKFMCSGIFIFIVIVIVLIIYFSTKSTPESPTPSASYNKAVVDAAIASSGIKTPTEKFQNETIVYDSVDKIKQNFTAFMNTYYPFLDINTMNKMLKDDYGINKTMQEIINDHPDVYFKQYLIQLAGMSMFSNMVLDNQTDTILCGLGYVTIMKLNIPKDTYEIYHLNDYEEVKDFMIYYIPTSFDKTKITNTNSEINFPPNYNDSVLFPNNTGMDVKPFKFGFKKLNESKIKEMIENADTKAGKTTSSITESDINNFLNIFKANKNSIIRYVRLMLIAPFIKLHTNETITTSSKVISDLVDLFTPNKYFNSAITPYLPSADFINMSLLVDTIFIPK